MTPANNRKIRISTVADMAAFLGRKQLQTQRSHGYISAISFICSENCYICKFGGARSGRNEKCEELKQKREKRRPRKERRVEVGMDFRG